MRRTATDRKYEAACAEQLTAQASAQRSNAQPAQQPAAGYKWVKNMMTQQWVEQAIDTPHCCDVSSETYWSM